MNCLNEVSGLCIFLARTLKDFFSLSLFFFFYNQESNIQGKALNNKECIILQTDSQSRGGRCEEIPHERVSGQFPFKQGSGVRLIKN